MIKEEKVLVNINTRNKKIYEEKGYIINNEKKIEININDLTDGNKTKTAEDISNISNLCITKRYINSSKNKKIEQDFSL